MKKFGLILCFLFVTSCSLNDESFYQSGVVPQRPVNGFNRNSLFPRRLNSALVLTGEMHTMFQGRTDWNLSKMDFRKAYPNFKIELLTFNSFNSPNNFTWQERIMFADALELVVFAVNHPLFEEKMKLETFYNNTGTQIESSTKIVQKLKNTVMTFIIAKDDLPKNTLAQATVGQFQHMIWFRSDTDYQLYDVVYLATILGHELTHNLGYLHASNVPYRIQDVILEIINEASQKDARLFEILTPSYYENMFLQRVRNSSPRNNARSLSTHIQQDTAKDFSDIF